MDNKKEAINGAKWTTLSTVISTVLQFSQVLIMARLLSPAAFGIISISTIIINFFNIFTDLGFSNSVISRQENDKKALSTIYFFNILFGIVIFGLIYISTPLIVHHFGDPKLDKVVKLASAFFLIVYFGHLHGIILLKELQFKASAICDTASAVTGTAVAIFLGYQGFEELSLIYGQLAMVTVKTILQLFYGLKFFTPQLYFNLGKIKEHIKFGLYNVGDGLIGFASSNLDFILIGSLLGTKQLGYYTIAFQLAVFPINKLNPIILKIAYPLLARMEEKGADLKQPYLKLLDLVSFANFPLIAGIFVIAESAVPLFYGPGWEASISLVRILVFVGFLRCLAHPLFTLVYSKNRPSLLFYANLVTILIQWPLLYVCAQYWQITGVAFGFLLVAFINLSIGFLIVRHLVGSFLMDFCKHIYKQVSFCLLMIAIISFYKFFVADISLLNTIVQVGIGGLIYLALTLKFKYSFTELRTLKSTL